MTNRATPAGRAKARARPSPSSIVRRPPSWSPETKARVRRGTRARPSATPTRPSGSWYSRSALYSTDRAPSFDPARNWLTRELIWKAPPASTPGMARASVFLTPVVRRGHDRLIPTPRRRTPHHSSAAWITPDTVTAALTAIRIWGWAIGTTLGAISGTRVHRFRNTGTPADRANRPPVFSTPDSSDAMVMQARYGMVSCAAVTAARITASSSRQADSSHGMIHGMATCNRMQKAATTAKMKLSASDAVTAAAASPSRARTPP